MTTPERGTERGQWFVSRTGGSPQTGWSWFIRNWDGGTVKGKDGYARLFDTEAEAEQALAALSADPAPTAGQDAGGGA